ncbi:MULTISPECIES: nucleoside triphosphate pyrophosphohydrolase [Thermoactinomyces]|uniref:Nucleoside triphosphate pyrophosphohydrolase n=1 Tax=Thermoactinomyces daqus TaxID=1329516 RepID=A0A7W2AHX9_9BACL|nr:MULTISPECIES: nucleoside triphosphate pyrophosphohydrolase [Thermoactinomyces]MBA4543211.1 nucleoside triphosphate pyrophosphohydrolase [Thermoactinomyces daqus]MBH8597712.1 nucleoside triphosphate pyrophosphohydrolase [Thermoactinomyces sp. CICC 10523]MBH8604052.1 nucleoside triphosphate pyrophosphohydrolase [Thermoactinomyces sp. CICC 10522]MBH8606413.1 nucleoside triphosphate pyrophosphohydrolase [Thermoactinomyces sp. CICC 10521]
MPAYNKLVRDLIPRVIEHAGKKCRTRVLDEKEYKAELQKKLREEVNEYLSSRNDQEALEELADVLEILHALTESHGFAIKDLEDLRRRKAEERGRFKQKIFLIDVED